MAIEESLGPLYQAVKRAPVEIRDASAGLMGRGSVATLDRSLESALREGAHTATVTLPTGQKIVQHIGAADGGAAALDDLAARIRKALEQAPAAAVEQALGPADAAALRARSPRVRESSATPFFMRLFGGTWHQASELAPETVAGEAEVRVEAGLASVLNRGARPLTLQLRQAALRPLNIVLPPSCGASVRCGAGPWEPRIETSFGARALDQLIRLRMENGLSAMSGVARTLRADEDLESAQSNPSAAVAACYIMLRSGDMDEAARAIRSNASRLPPQPDLLLLQAELDARRGDDDAAEAGFLRAADCGLPMFSTGLAILVDRLRMYLQSAPQEQAGALKARLVRLQRVALRCEFKLAFTNYTGAAPAEPGDEVLAQDAPVPPAALAVGTGAQT